MLTQGKILLTILMVFLRYSMYIYIIYICCSGCWPWSFQVLQRCLRPRNLCSPFYQVLVRTSTEDRKAALETLNNNIDELEAGTAIHPFFLRSLRSHNVKVCPRPGSTDLTSWESNWLRQTLLSSHGLTAFCTARFWSASEAGNALLRIQDSLMIQTSKGIESWKELRYASGPGVSCKYFWTDLRKAVFICFHEVFQSSFAVCKFHSKEIQEWCLLQVQTMPLIWPLVPS